MTSSTNRFSATLLVAATSLLSLGCGGAAASAGGSELPSAPDQDEGSPPTNASASPDLADAGAEADREPSATHVEFKDPEKWTKKWDTEERDAWQKPDLVVAALELTPETRIADVGAGTGYFSIRIARVARAGRVFAVELESSMLEFIGDRAKGENLDNVELVVGSPKSPNLPEPVDLILLVNTYHHISDRETYFEGLKPSLGEGGRIAIVDFRMGDLPVGPKDPHKISQWQVTREMERAGYGVCRRYDDLPHQYMLFFGTDCETPEQP